MGLFTNVFSSKGRDRNKEEVVVLMGHFGYDVEVIGGKNAQAALEAICGPRMPTGVHRYENAWLIQEESNPQEKNRVRVEIRGRTVGYLRPETALHYRKHLEARGTPKADGRCQALIKGGWYSHDGRKGLYTVSLDLPVHGI